MLALFETPAGFALFKCDDSKLTSVDDISKHFDSESSALKTANLKAFSKFENTAQALEAFSELNDGSMSESLKKFLKKELKGIDNEKLAVGDNKLAKSIAKKFSIPVLSDSSLVMEVMRGIRLQIVSLLQKCISDKEFNTMALGLSHSMSRYKLKFSPDKVDTMVVQAIALLDDLDKELNTYAMKLKEWYGWHFPELTKALVDNLAYARVIRLMGFRTNASTTDFSALLPEELEKQLKELAEVSMGTEITEEDLLNIHMLADQVISLSEYRAELYEYLRNRMIAIAPNLTALVGELVGARLISHAGSLLNLAKQPASTVQILGAEKALFRALKTKANTPKYGLIFHASLVGQAGPKLKGKMARVLAAKTALSIRVDALSDNTSKEAMAASIGLTDRIKVEQRLRQLSEHSVASQALGARQPVNHKKFEFTSGAKQYNTCADIQKRPREDVVDVPAKKQKTEEPQDISEKKERKDKKEKKDKKDKSKTKEEKDKE